MWCFFTGLAAHTGTALGVCAQLRLNTVDNGGDLFFFASWALAVVFAILSRKLNYPIVGAFLIPAVVLLMGSSSYLLHLEDTAPVASSALVDSGLSGVILPLLHGVPALVSVVSLALAFVVSAVFLISERKLKRKPAQALSLSGPNLQLLDALNRHLVQVGFVAISLVVLSGGLLAVSQQKSVFVWDTSVLTGITVWLLLAAILHVRTILQWSPKRISRLTVLVTGLFFVSVFSVMFVSGRLNHAALIF